MEDTKALGANGNYFNSCSRQYTVTCTVVLIMAGFGDKGRST